jgi:hypothetical protein
MRCDAPDTRSLECELAGERTRAFLAGTDRTGERAELRAHLGRCPPCRARYVEVVEAWARRSRPVAPRAASRAGRAGGILRLVLPAAALLVWLQAGTGTASKAAEALALSGPVHVATTPLSAGERAALACGSTCSTGIGGQAQLAFATARLAMGPSTDVLVERDAGARIRLCIGTLRFEGECTIATPLGVAAARGSGSVALDGDGLELLCATGEVEWTDGLRRRRLAAGETTRLAAAGDLP